MLRDRSFNYFSGGGGRVVTTVTSVASQLLRAVGVGVFTTVTTDAIQHLRAVEGEGGGDRDDWILKGEPSLSLEKIIVINQFFTVSQNLQL